MDANTRGKTPPLSGAMCVAVALPYFKISREPILKCDFVASAWTQVNEGDPALNGTTPLLLAVRLGHADIVATLLTANADVNGTGASLQPALHSWLGCPTGGRVAHLACARARARTADGPSAPSPPRPAGADSAGALAC